MSIITSNQQKRQTTVDPLFILFFSVLVVLLIFAFTATHGNYLTGSLLQSSERAVAGLSLHSEVSFASDLRYWNEYCDSGWSSNSACDAIVARTRACTASVDSAYCSTYESYLQQFNH